MGSLPGVVEDVHGVLQVYSDGSIFRETDVNFNIPVHDDGSVIWEDHTFDQKNNLQLRLYKPLLASSNKSLPIVFFFHGGGFCLGSFTWPNHHNACLRLASGLQAIVVAPDYRLAPEHRLPAAIEDALSSLEWLRGHASQSGGSDVTWLHDGVDFDRVYIVGDSSGGNIAHHLAVHLGHGSPEMAPVRVRGYVLMAPFFGGTVRTKSEAEGEPEPLLTLDALDRFWRISLPLGKNADHPLANPFGPSSKSLKSVTLDPILVIAGSRELMRDRVKNYAEKLKDLGKNVRYVELEGEHHGFFGYNPYSKSGTSVLQEIKDLIFKLCD